MDRPSALKTALNYGALSGLAGFGFFLLLHFSGINPLGPASWMGAWVPVVFIVLSTRHFRNHECGGYIEYWPAFRIGFLTAAAGGFLFALLMWAFGTVIDATLLTRFKEESLELLEQSAALSKSMFGESVYQQSLENLQKTDLTTLSIQEFMNKSLGGLLVALITAAIFRKQQPTIQS